MMGDWNPFMVRNLEPGLLEKLGRDAEKQGRSRADFMRSILCEHYGLDCPPSYAPPRSRSGTRTVRLEMHPELRQAIKAESEHTGVSMQALVHEALEYYYAVA